MDTTPASPSRRPTTRYTPLARLGVAVLATVLLSACSAVVRVQPDGPREVHVTARASGAIRIVRVPTSRPPAGIAVRRDDGPTFRVPPGHYPPPGQCRIWRPEVPPGRQDPPGDCDELERRVPLGAYLVVG